MILSFDDILLRHQKSVVNSRSECSTEITLGKNTFAVPVVAANMKSILTPEICEQFDEANWFYVYPRVDGAEDVFNFAYKYAEIKDFNVRSISVGVKHEWLELVRKLKEYGVRVDYFTVDVALSYNDNILPILRTIKESYPDSYIICGNGATGEWVQWVESFGLVDCIKVGIGVSKSCRTKEFTGYGSSTAGSLIECYQASDEVDIISDGGHSHIGDVAKALVLGADMVMSGSFFSKCIDSPAIIHGYYGNASREAKGNDHVEGELIKVESNGLTIKEMMKLIQQSLRSSISYAGVTNVEQLFGRPYEVKNI